MTHIKNHKLIHLIGIGGCSMNGLAEIFKSLGYEVQGSDVRESVFTDRMKDLGVPVKIGHAAENLGEADLIVYSAAIKPENVERMAARERGIMELERSVALGQLTEGYEKVVGIAGCHGKTTITSMLAYIMAEGGPNATVHIGGMVDILGGGVKIGTESLFITEACEYVESFLTLRPTIALINNIDNDHLDYFKSIENIVSAYEKFLALLPENGIFIGFNGDYRVQRLMDDHGGRVISYGYENANYTPKNISFDEFGCPSFTLMHEGSELIKIKLTVPGEHNVINAMAAAVTALVCGASPETISSALTKFKNTKRRFELMGNRNGVSVYHDYGHHPSEISVAVAAAKKVPHNKLICVFQCNSYTRALTLFTENVTCFSFADEVLVPNIYPGREVDTGLVHAMDMVNAINEQSNNAKYIPTFEEINEYLLQNASEGDLVLTLGSGDVYVQTEKLYK